MHEIARGLDIFELTPTKYLTQNEIDAAKAVQVAELNVQNQQQIVWPKNLTVAKAYVDQLERSQALPSDRITELRAAIEKGNTGSLKKLAPALEKDAAAAKTPADANRMTALAEILKAPAK